MASASRQFYLFISRTAACSPAKRQCRAFAQRTQVSPIRSITTTAPRWSQSSRPPPPYSNGYEDDEPSDFDATDLQKPAQPLQASDLDPVQRAHLSSLSKSEQTQHLAIQNHLKAVLDQEDQLPADFEAEMDDLARTIERELPDLDFREHKNLPGIKAGFWADDEADDEFTQLPDDDDSSDESHLSSIAESELEVHREVREYMRIAAWDLPLLSKFAKPFQPPTHATPLRFRYTTYLGESHPASAKVVLEFSPTDLSVSASLTPPQTQKLLKLAGVRYNPNTDTVKMSCEKFENAAQNKRWLGDVVQKLVKECKEGKDTFEDVPLDLRHVKQKKRALFPEEWCITEETVQKVLEGRREVGLLADGIAKEGEKEDGKAAPVDGGKLVEEYVLANTVVPTPAQMGMGTRQVDKRTSYTR